MTVIARVDIWALSMAADALPVSVQVGGLAMSSSGVTAGSTAMNVFNISASMRGASSIDTTDDGGLRETPPEVPCIPVVGQLVSDAFSPWKESSS